MIGREAGKHSETVKRARKLVRDRTERTVRGVCIVEGTRVVADYLELDAPIELAIAARSAGEDDALLRALDARAGELLRIDDDVFRSLAGTRSPQGILLVVPRPATRTLPPAGDRPLLVGWGLQDPSNVGALVRAAAAGGCEGALFARAPGEALADPFSPRAVRAAAGACFRLPLVERDLRPADLAAELISRGYRPVALTPRDGRAPEALDLCGPTALLVGSETRGLPAELEDAGRLLTLPLEHGVESLGAAAAGAVVLFEAARQRRVEAPTEEG